MLELGLGLVSSEVLDLKGALNKSINDYLSKNKKDSIFLDDDIEDIQQFIRTHYISDRVQNGDTDNGQSFIMNIYFKQFNNTGAYWIAPASVVVQGQVFTGTFHLSDLDMSVLGSSIIPENMSEYASAYSSSLHWLAFYCVFIK